MNMCLGRSIVDENAPGRRVPQKAESTVTTVTPVTSAGRATTAPVAKTMKATQDAKATKVTKAAKATSTGTFMADAQPLAVHTVTGVHRGTARGAAPSCVPGI